MKNFFLFLFFIVLFSSCASNVDVHSCVSGQPYGFLSGLLHGIIAPITFIISFFRDDVSVYAINNNGHWYTFGFLLGIGSFTGGCSRVNK